MKILKHIGIDLVVLCLFLSSATATNAVLKGFTSNCLDAKVAGPDRAQMLIIDAPGKKPKENKKTYIFMCSGAKNICGASSTDGTDINKILFGVSSQRADDELGKVGIQKQGSITSGKNPTTTSWSGTTFVDDPIVIAQYTQHGIYHRFYWVQSASDDGEITPAPTLPDDQGLVEDVGSDGGLKLAQIPFDEEITPTPTSGVPAAGKNCANIKWDPRGYIFDAKTLNPVKDVTVTLYEKNSNGSFTQVENGIGLINPYTTATDSGQFNFFVNPGLYRMTVDPKNATIAEKNAINPAYEQLFIDEKGLTNIYEKDTDIEEVAGRVAVAHIPVNITDKSLIIESLQLLIKDAVVGINNQTKKSQMHITGTVSHPKSKLTVTLTALDGAGKLIIMAPIVSSTSDLGEYDTYIDQEQVGIDNKPLYLQKINVKLELNSFYSSQSSSPKTSISYDVKPLPLYLEGIAYDESGVPIPNAVVGVYPFFSFNPMYLVVADENGRFKIGSAHVPQMNFTLKYKKPSGEVIVTQPETFIKQNISLLVKEEINPFYSKEISSAEDKAMQILVDKIVSEKDLQTLSRTIGRSGGGSSYSPSNGDVANAPLPMAAPVTNFTLIFIAFILIVLIVVSIIVGIKLKQKNNF
ncbi:MAG: hypothetical protein WA061_01380 [Microgenomates group bacterium]